MVLKRIIRQFLNQHFPENIIPAKKLDRKSKKILENQNYFRYIPLLRRIKKAQSYLKKSQIYRVNDKIDQSTHQYNHDQLKNQYHPFFKDIEQCSTSITCVDTSTIHRKTELCKDYSINQFSPDLYKNIIPFNQWTGIDINCLTLRNKFYRLQKARYYLYSLSQYKAGFARKYDRRDPSSFYKSQLMERKKLGLLYGNLSKKEIYRTIQRAEKYRGVLRENILRLLESRLDVILYRIGFFKSIPSARQGIIHRNILVNQQVVTIAHYQVKAGDMISVDRKKSSNLKDVIQRRLERILFLDFNQRRQTQSRFWPFIGNRRVLKKIIKFATLKNFKKYILQAINKTVQNHCNQLGLSRKTSHRYTKFLHKYQKRFNNPRWKSKRNSHQRNYINGVDHNKFLHNKQKLHHRKSMVFFQRKHKKPLRDARFVFFKKIAKENKKKWLKLVQQRTTLAYCFKTIKRLKILTTIATLASKEYNIKMRDPLFSYKFLTLIKNTKAPFFSSYITKMPAFFGIKKPLHLEISYRTLTAIYLYSPQKLFFPVNLDIDGVKKSYY